MNQHDVKHASSDFCSSNKVLSFEQRWTWKPQQCPRLVIQSFSRIYEILLDSTYKWVDPKPSSRDGPVSPPQATGNNGQ